MIAHGVVADVDAHLLGEPAVVGGVRGCLPRHTELGQRAAGHAACAARQLAAQRAVIKLIHAKTPAIIQKHYDHIFFYLLCVGCCPETKLVFCKQTTRTCVVFFLSFMFFHVSDDDAV